jgi:hypothetical protein
MKIAGYNIGKKQIIIVGIIVVIIAIASMYSNAKKEKEKEARLAAAREEKEQSTTEKSTTEELSRSEQVQQQLVKKYGDAPEGFEWDKQGNLIALSDDESTPEDVMYYFLRSLSVLDFSTAQRYSDNSYVISSYQKYYTDQQESRTSYYNNFLRKQFKFSLESLEVLSIEDTAVFADGTEYITIKVNTLDLTDKDFWEADKDEIFQTMRTYEETETDNTKAKQYLYDYIYSKYEDGTVGKKESTLELILTKSNGEGWLVTGDGELNDLLQYNKGVDVAQYIINEYTDWYKDVVREESRMEREASKSSSDEDTTSSGQTSDGYVELE